MPTDSRFQSLNVLLLPQKYEYAFTQTLEINL